MLRIRSLVTRTQSILNRKSSLTNTVFSRGFAVNRLDSEEALDDAIAQSREKLVVVNWTAGWCGPCKQIAPYLETLSEEHPEVLIVKADVDEMPDAAADYEVQAMPTFQFHKDGEQVDQMLGADRNKLKMLMEKHGQ